MMTDIIVKIMVGLLSVLSLATKQIKRGRFSTSPLNINSGSLNVRQGHLQRSCWETARSGLCFGGWID